MTTPRRLRRPEPKREGDDLIVAEIDTEAYGYIERDSAPISEWFKKRVAAYFGGDK